MPAREQPPSTANVKADQGQHPRGPARAGSRNTRLLGIEPGTHGFPWRDKSLPNQVEDNLFTRTPQVIKVPPTPQPKLKSSYSSSAGIEQGLLGYQFSQRVEPFLGPERPATGAV